MLKKIVALCAMLVLAFSLFGCEIPANRANEFAEYKTTAKAELDTYATSKDAKNYTATSWAEILECVAEGKTAIDAAKDNSAVDSAVTTAKLAIDTVWTIKKTQADLVAYKTAAIEEINAYVESEGGNNYVAVSRTEIFGCAYAGWIEVEASENKLAVNSAVTAAKLAIDGAIGLAVYKVAAIADFKAYAENKGQSNYTPNHWASLIARVNGFEAHVSSVIEKDAIDALVMQYKQLIDEIITLQDDADLIAYKEASKTEIEAYVTNKGQSNYAPEYWTSIISYVNFTKEQIDLTAGKSSVDALLIKYKKAIDAVFTDEEEKTAYKDAAIAELEAYAKHEDYTAGNWEKVTGYVEVGRNRIEVAYDKATVDTAVAGVKYSTDRISTNDFLFTVSVNKTTLVQGESLYIRGEFKNQSGKACDVGMFLFLGHELPGWSMPAYDMGPPTPIFLEDGDSYVRSYADHGYHREIPWRTSVEPGEYELRAYTIFYLDFGSATGAEISRQGRYIEVWCDPITITVLEK